MSGLGGGQGKEGLTVPMSGGKVTGFSPSRGVDTRRIWWLRVWGRPHGVKCLAWGIEDSAGQEVPGLEYF